MDISTTAHGDATVLAVTGRVDGATTPQFEDQILQLIAAGHRRIVVDLGGLDYIGSAGLRAILIAGKQLKPEGGRLVLAAPRPLVAQVLQISGFWNIFDTCATVEEALTRARASG